MTGRARSLGLGMPLNHLGWEQKGMCSPKKMEVLLPEAGRMDVEQKKQQLSPFAAKPFGQIKSWEARHANHRLKPSSVRLTQTLLQHERKENSTYPGEKREGAHLRRFLVPLFSGWKLRSPKEKGAHPFLIL